MSTPRVTITLGRTGQVVQRSASVPDEKFSDRTPPTSKKRPISERLGSNVNNVSSYAHHSNLKRQRQNDLKGKYDHDDDEDGDVLQFSNGQVGVQDLRMKLLRKNSSRTFQSGSGSQNGVRDLREKLSGKRQSPPTTKNVLRHMSSSRTMDASRRISSSRTMDASERTLPTRITNASRRMSPPETIDASWQTSSPRNIDLSRNTSSPRTVDASRHASFLVKVNPAAKSIGASKPIVRSVSGPSSSTHKHAYPAEDLTVASLLHSLGLGKYSIIFQAEEVDMTALRHMGDDDLKELGIPMGPRKKILLALPSYSRRR